MAGSFSLAESFKCMICHDLADDACETSCCHQIGCRQCLLSLQQNACPSCREDTLTYDGAVAVQRAIASVPVPCPNKCGVHIAKGELKTHLKICENRHYKCIISDCDFTGVETSFAEHLLREHLRTVLKKFDAFEHEDNEHEKCPVGSCDEQISKDDFRDHLLKNHLADLKRLGFFECMACMPRRFVKKAEWETHNQFHLNTTRTDIVSICVISKDKPVVLKNLEGRPVKMGRNGKFYCGKQDGVVDKNSARFSCDQTLGYNCVECMKLDVMFRNLPPYHLVNKIGLASRAESCHCAANPDKMTFFNRKSRRSLCSMEKCGQNPSFFCEQTTFVKQSVDDASGTLGICGGMKSYCGACLELSDIIGQNNFYGNVWE